MAHRRLPCAPAAVFAAFADPAVLGRWWGPHGFTTTFSDFAFVVGARWAYVMAGPNGTHHANEARVLMLDATFVGLADLVAGTTSVERWGVAPFGLLVAGLAGVLRRVRPARTPA